MAASGSSSASAVPAAAPPAGPAAAGAPAAAAAPTAAGASVAPTAPGASVAPTARRRLGRPDSARRLDCGAFGRQLGQAVAGERLELAGHAVRPHAAGRRAVDERAGGDGLLGVLLPQQPVADLVPALGRQAARAGAERVERVVGARAHLVGVEAQQAREVVVALALAQQELEDGLLVGGKGFETAHEGSGG